MVMRNFFEAHEEKPLFQLFYLKDDENESVEVEEVEEIDFGEVKKRLKQGESVFITSKRKQKLSTSLSAREDVAELWYFAHM